MFAFASADNRHLRLSYAAPLLMVASGFAGLGYQIVWTQQCALWLGHEAASVLAVVTAFFGGIAIGALLFGPRIDRSAKPLRWYAGCELVIALWGLFLALSMSWLTDRLLDLTGVQPTPTWQWTVAFCGTFLFLLPATAAMGATLPAMERALAHARIEARSIALLYASNTLGAVIGVLGVAFWLVPKFGLLRAAVICVVLNVACGVLSLSLFLPKEQVSVISIPLERRVARQVLWRLAFTGLLGIGYEILVVRVLSQVLEDTVYTFATLLAVYLVGSALGAAGYQRWFATSDKPQKLVDQLLCALAATCVLGAASLWAAEQIKALTLHSLGTSVAAALSAEAVLALIAFGPSTIVMGALFSHLSVSARDVGVSFGRSLGFNTLGAAAAPVIFGVFAFPLLGAKLSLALIGFGYLTLITWRTWATPWFLLHASGVLALVFWAPPLVFIDVPEGGHVVSYQEGVMAAVSVVEDTEGVTRLRINNRQQEGSNATLRVDARQGLLPMFLHTAPRRVLFLGLGTGVTASSAAQDPTLQVDAVELLPEVVTASAHFTQVFSDSDSRLNVITADARRFVRVSNEQYDVIVSDNFHPARSGSGSLYTVEHFRAVRNRLTSHGVFCQWLPLHQLDSETLRHIVQAFLSVYPRGFAMLASNSLDTPVLGLIGRADEGRFDVTSIRQRIESARFPESLAHIGIEDEFAILGSFVAGPSALRRFAGNSAANTDDHPIVAYLAPRITYVPDSLPRDRLIALLHEFAIDPIEVVASADELWSQRLAAYWKGRDYFIESGRNVRPSSDAQAMLAQVREPLLSVLRISPDFRPAYDPLVYMATSLAQTNASGARELLMELTNIQPARLEARVALSRISAAP